MVNRKKEQPALSGGPPSDEIGKAARQQLERLFSSSLFSRAHQLWPVLEAIVEQSLGNHQLFVRRIADARRLLPIPECRIHYLDVSHASLP